MVEEIFVQLATYFPWYVFLVLLPMGVRIIVERSFGIRHEVFRLPPPTGLAYETAFRGLVLVSLYYPFYEEIVFRGMPLYNFGYWGLVAGSVVWTLMHPAWQLQYLAEYPTWKKLLFTATCTFYYACNAVFYGMMWLTGAGIGAILYHVMHNLWLTLIDMFQEVEVPTPWKKPKFVKEGESPEEPRLLTMRFVQPKSSANGSSLVGSRQTNVFVKRKLKNME